MKADPILREVHALKEQLAREVEYDLHALCERSRQAEQRHAKRVASFHRAKQDDATSDQ